VSEDEIVCEKCGHVYEANTDLELIDEWIAHRQIDPLIHEIEEVMSKQT
jgi:hypothetical protein